jgi:hypothetical protein
MIWVLSSVCLGNDRLLDLYPLIISAQSWSISNPYLIETKIFQKDVLNSLPLLRSKHYSEAFLVFDLCYNLKNDNGLVFEIGIQQKERSCEFELERVLLRLGSLEWLSWKIVEKEKRAQVLFQFIDNQGKKQLVFPLLNTSYLTIKKLIDGHDIVDIDRSLYSNSVKNSYRKYVHFFPLKSPFIESLFSEFGQRERLSGKQSDSIVKGTADKCHEVGSRCESLFRNDCSKCRFGVLEIFNSKCATGGTKYCSLEACGGRGQLACYLGKMHILKSGLMGCHPNSMEAICKKGARLICENGLMVCH